MGNMFYKIMEDHSFVKVGEYILQTNKERRVAWDSINGGYVSTVFLGIDSTD